VLSGGSARTSSTQASDAQCSDFPAFSAVAHELQLQQHGMRIADRERIHRTGRPSIGPAGNAADFLRASMHALEVGGVFFWLRFRGSWGTHGCNAFGEVAEVLR
jgi:hypothetical protein